MSISNTIKNPLLVILVLAILVAGGIWAYQEWAERQQSPTRPDETADWKTYRNEKYGFKFEYPAYLLPIQSQDKTEFFFEKDYREKDLRLQQGISTNPIITIYMRNLQGQTLDEWVNDIVVEPENEFAIYRGKVFFAKHQFEFITYGALGSYALYVTPLSLQKTYFAFRTSIIGSDFEIREDVQRILESLQF